MHLHNSRQALRAYLYGAFLGLGLFALPAWAAHSLVNLAGSDFEIEDPGMPGDGEPGANIRLDHLDMIDWADASGALTSGVDWKTDENIIIGNKNDDTAFGQGTDEDDPVPTVVAGGVPPNKSDLKKFGIFTEEGLTDTFIHMFWTRVQDPSGTTNMDFEFNQSDVLSANGVTPVRTAKDMLIQYDLANGGTRPELFISFWETEESSGGVPASQVCEVLKSYPCWGARTNLSSEGLATGSINKVAIPHNEADGLDEGMGLSARTFGEASINLTEVVGAGECVTFGSAYLKSRSSDSFNAALKDFIPPLATSVSNCAGIKIRKKDDAGELLPGAEFTLYRDNAPKGEFDTGDTVVLDNDDAPLTCTTAANGECSFTLIFEGDYCAVETDHPDHYLPADPECFTVDPATPILTVDFIDRRLGSVLVKKVDQGGAPLSGAVFKIIDADPDDADVPALPITMTEGPSGYHCADDLPLKDASLAEISYTVSETTVPDGYIGASDASISAVFETCAERSTDSPDLTFENRSANFKLIKLDDTGAAHAGVAFTLFRDDGDLEYEPLVDTTVFDASCVTDANGECTFETVHAGDYCLVETTVLDNYVTAGPQCFSFVPGADPDLTYTFRNWRLGSILVKKTDETGAVLAGATMEITATSVEDANIPPLNIALTEGPEGYHCVDGLPLKDASLADITYTVSETGVPDGYIGAADQTTQPVFQSCSERSTDSPNLTFANTSANFKLIKLDDTGAAHAGVAFTLFQDDGDLVYEPLVDTTVFDASCLTDANGECTFETVHAGDYCLVETTVLDNYVAAGPQCFSFVPGADPDLTYTFRNWRLGSILVKKTDETGAVLAGATMEITATSVEDANIPPLNIALTEGPEGYHCVDGLPLKDASLADITYTVSETGVPDGYIGGADQTTQPVFLSCSERSTDTPDLTFKNERKPGAIKITKTTKNVSSDPATVAHPGVTFSIYDSSDVFVDSVVTDGSGVACLGNLDVGETYKVVETTPDGYAGETAKTVLVDDDAVCGEGNEDAVSFHNTPLGKFSISYDSLPTDGHGATKATVTCSDAGIGPVDLFDGDVSTSNSLNFESQATYNCTIVVDP